MPARRKLPSDSRLVAMRDRGMTHQEIADAISAEIHEPVTRVAVSVKFSRIGETDRQRYHEVVPWDVALEHQRDYNLAMLRVQGRLNRKYHVDGVTLSKFETWKRHLKADDAVVFYKRDSAEGFHWVPRFKGERGLIRQPERELVGSGTGAPRARVRGS